MDWLGPMSDAIERAKAAGMGIPPSPRNAQKEACPSYHIKGIFNARFRRVGDHHPYPTGGY